MAFPVPSHLPRKPANNDVTSKILSSIDSASMKTINSSMATSWIAELDESIHSTKAQIHDRIQQNLPQFKHQLELSKSVQSRMSQLTEEVDALNETISNPSTGLVPKTLDTLKRHSTLAQETLDASVASESLAHLLKFRQHYTSVMSLVQFGKLPEAVVASIDLDELVSSAPDALKKATIMRDLQGRAQALKLNVEGQLLEALSRSVTIRSGLLEIQHQVQVRNTDASVTLDRILHSLSSVAIDDYLSTLRRDFVANFVDRVMQQPYSINAETSNARHSITLTPSSPNTELRITRLDNLSSIFDFVAQHLFPSLPQSRSTTFLRSLSKPVITSVLNLYLIPQLPSSFGLLPPFLELVQAAVDFEERYVTRLLDPGSHDQILKDWSNGLSGHYERQRRTAILARSRELMSEKIDLTATFQADVERTLDSSYPIVVNGSPAEEDAWGFDDESGLNTSQTDSWGFEDDTAQEPESPVAEAAKEVVSDPINGANEDEPNPDDAWGWNDDETVSNDDPVEDTPQEEPIDDNVWDDDPWAESSTDEFEPEPIAPSPPPPPAINPAPKAATRLERMASKNKGQTNGTASNQSVSSPPPPLTISEPNSAGTAEPSANTVSLRSSKSTNSMRRPANIVVSSPAETYRVTSKMKQIVRFVEDVVAESKQFAASNLFAKSPNGVTNVGTTLIQSASSVMDLYQALYPVRFEQELSTIEGAMQFSNDCIYLSESVDKIEREAANHPQLKERLAECRNDLKVLGDSWFEDAVNRESLRNDKILVDGTQRFSFTGDQDRYDECEEAINTVVRSIKNLARRIKPIPSKSKYYQAIGRLVDTALSRVLRDIISLPDIPELESNKLSELCRIFNSLEGLFSEDPTQSTFVVAYVPSWLKFSYLSELLEATMADISYLFEQGALVDFEIDELVNLVRALFADTQLRTNTINKLLEGHPDSPSS
ncbi:hypothetical protein DFP72DRAFT_626225 [Ephemerocybe angulata]|uniref:ZW10 C-terminal helical domain-containing protein n=1 Tax=Ephemerocybe angulata TaxID=980116 RepID=A0A8H6I9W8_9AGAR|nr:hypothetical protein DFP72DRAFT_626225 [Tulosesus angulatus]